jgi:multicomponent Na+:H+ antiporter subunit G
MIDAARIIAALLVLTGSGFAVLSAIGVLRLPDLYTRMHSASKAGLVGAGLILLAVAAVSFDSAVALRAIIGLLFLVLTTPVSAHLLARAAYKAGIRPTAETDIEDMPDDKLKPLK